MDWDNVSRNDNRTTQSPAQREGQISEFAESYASFNRIINNLQRQYIELKEEFSAQNETLAETNRRLLEVTGQNLAATEFLDGILGSVTVGIIAVDRNGAVTHFNPAAALLFGVPVRDPLGKFYRDVIPPGNPPDANALRTVESGRTVDAVEREVVLKDGTRLHLSVSTAIMRDAEGNPTGAVEVLHDLTKIKRMEQEISRLKTLAALGEMAATIAHEVRNPLAAIGGFAALLRRDIDPADQRHKLVEKICHGVDSLNGTISALLSYTRVEELEKEELVFDEYLDRLRREFTYEHPELAGQTDITVRPVHGPQAAPIHLAIDPMMMKRLFFNLFTNAIEAGGGGSRIEVTYQVLPRQRATQCYGDRMMLGLDETIVATTITDDGPGIPDESRERLFAPFFTTKQGGTGLGLAVVWKVTKAHGGDIFADGNPEQGARFVLLLPTRITPSAGRLDEPSA